MTGFFDDDKIKKTHWYSLKNLFGKSRLQKTLTCRKSSLQLYRKKYYIMNLVGLSSFISIPEKRFKAFYGTFFILTWKIFHQIRAQQRILIFRKKKMFHLHILRKFLFQTKKFFFRFFKMFETIDKNSCQNCGFSCKNSIHIS